MARDPRPAVASTTLGAIGRFGNQVLQYGFLRQYAERHALALETPAWIGAELFGLEDASVRERRPVVTEIELGVFGPDFEARPAAAGADLWGWFQIDTARLDRARLRRLLRPVPGVEAVLAAGERRLRARGRTLVGVHLRRGDFRPAWGHPLIDRLYPRTGVAAYRDWLADLWPSLDRPVLFLASDEPAAAAADLADFHPQTAATLGLDLPLAPEFPDFFLLSRCDALAIANSTFSFAAALLAPRARHCARPAAGSGRLEPFDPAASPPQLALAPARALELADRARFEQLAAAQAPDRLILRANVAAGSRATAILGDAHHRGRLALEVDLAGSGRPLLRARWDDEEDDAAGFEFASEGRCALHGDRPPLLGLAGRARGRRLDGPAWALLVAAAVPERPGDVFVALSLLTPGLHSFFVEARAEGSVHAGSAGGG